MKILWLLAAVVAGRRTKQAKANLDPRVGPRVAPQVGPRVDPRVRSRDRPRERPRQDPRGLISLFQPFKDSHESSTKCPTKASTEVPTKVSNRVVKVHLSCFHLFCPSASNFDTAIGFCFFPQIFASVSLGKTKNVSQQSP